MEEGPAKKKQREVYVIDRIAVIDRIKELDKFHDCSLRSYQRDELAEFRKSTKEPSDRLFDTRMRSACAETRSEVYDEIMREIAKMPYKTMMVDVEP